MQQLRSIQYPVSTWNLKMRSKKEKNITNKIKKGKKKTIYIKHRTENQPIIMYTHL